MNRLTLFVCGASMLLMPASALEPERPALPKAAADLLIELQLFENEIRGEAADRGSRAREGLIKKLAEVQAESQEKGDLEAALTIKKSIESIESQDESAAGAGAHKKIEGRSELPSEAIALIDQYDQYITSLSGKAESAIAKKRRAVGEVLQQQIAALTKSGELEGALEVKKVAEELLDSKVDGSEAGDPGLAAEASSLPAGGLGNEWNPRTVDEFKKLLQARDWQWVEEGNNRTVTFMDDSRFRAEGRQGKFGWEVTGPKEVTVKLGAKQNQPMDFRFSIAKKELQPDGGVAASRKIIMRPMGD